MSERDIPSGEKRKSRANGRTSASGGERLGPQVAEFPGAFAYTFRRQSYSCCWRSLSECSPEWPWFVSALPSNGFASVFSGPRSAPPPLRVLLVPAGAGLVVAFLVQKFFRAARGSGVNQTKAAVYVFDGYVPFRTVIGKFLTCSLAIGSGQSLGPEDPSLQMGAGIASALGRRLKLSRDKLRLLAPVGAAAGLAAAFNAPISAVLFVIEEVIGTWSASALGAIVLAAVSSAVVMRSFLGGEPMFRVPPYTLAHPAELLAYAVLGVVSGVLSLAFTKIIAYFRPKLRALPEWTYYFQPAAAGLLIGFIGLRIPQAMGTGYPYIDQALHSQYTWEILARPWIRKNSDDELVVCQRHAGRNVRAGAVHRRDDWRSDWRARASFLPADQRVGCAVCAGRHGNFLCGFPACSDHFRVHGR